jgi:hypothetical protein
MAERETEEQGRRKFGCYLPDEAIERIRRASFHSGLTIGEVIDRATEEYIGRLEKKQGKPFGPITRTRLKVGRPISDAR